MFTEYQLGSFEKYLATTPKSLLGVYPITPEGAYDAATGARGHGFGQRRGIPYRAFSPSGVFAFDAGENGEEVNLSMSKSAQGWIALKKYLRQILSTEQMQEAGEMIENLCHHTKVEAMNGERDTEDDGELDTEGMDRRARRAGDNPPPFANGGRPNPGGRVDPATPMMMGRAGDGRNRRPLAADSKAKASFDALFPGASKVQHV